MSSQQVQDTATASVVALAGRRVHSTTVSPARFPQDRVAAVRRATADLLVQARALALVASAACGADLIGLEEAERLGIRRRIVLPFRPDRFRETSVADCPGEWVAAFDRLIEAASATGDLVVLDQPGANRDRAYAAANAAIIREAGQLAEAVAPGARLRLVAAVVWEGRARAEGDATEGFRALAEEAGFEVRTVLTVEPAA